jgi:lipid-A-disaccharide synthase
LDVVFTGHPLVDRAAETKAQIAPEFPWRGQHKIALLPGSRAGEISRILPRMLEAGARLEEKLSTESSFIIPAPTRGMLELARTIIDKSECKPRNLSLVEGQARALLLQADAAAVASGTATLEASLMRCPTVLVYCAGALTAVIARVLIKGVRFLGLANIIADKEVMPELLQESFTPENLAAHLHALLTDETLRRRTLTQLDAVNAMLGAGNAPARAAEAILDFISTHNKEKRMTGL